MKALLLVIPALVLSVPQALASDRVNWSVSIGSNAPVYVQPAPRVIYERAPVYVQEPVYESYRYERPARVYVQPAPVVTYVPRPVHREPYYDNGWRREHRHHRHHKHDGWRDR